ncbi:sigma-70 family RNA polymerase sigma factor [Pseudalkalibacillus caeni]|uniref:sigma-70 family RNA polymerase sigma factor n=1 Tax=Exobacillus caeni TaxID=2574798 RepID=UPI001485710D|nr:sigma-70 family RNA polymerase sigma factor [Pseudalkalibacillus caeni]
MEQYPLSFEEIARKYEPLIKSQLKKLHVFKDFELYYQAGLIGLWEAYLQFEESKGTFSSFAYSKIRWKITDEIKKDIRIQEKQTTVSDDVLSGVIDPSSVYLLETEILQSYLTGLTDNQCKWVVHSVLEQKQTKQIAAEEGVSIEAVKSWRKAAIKKIIQNAREMRTE